MPNLWETVVANKTQAESQAAARALAVAAPPPVTKPVLSPPVQPYPLLHALIAALDLPPCDWRDARKAAQRLWRADGSLWAEAVDTLPLSFHRIWGEALPCRSDWLWLQQHADEQRALMNFRQAQGMPKAFAVAREYEYATKEPIRLWSLVKALTDTSYGPQ